jgi:succinyl-diaminopimelate desuccinylase
MDRAAELQAWLEPHADEMAALLEDLVAIDTENPPGRSSSRAVTTEQLAPHTR